MEMETMKTGTAIEEAEVTTIETGIKMDPEEEIQRKHPLMPVSNQSSM